MSSCKSTVFPTPAPPNKPTFPPFKIGASRSITLIPVSKTSGSVFCSSKGGAGWYMDERSPFTSPFPSMGLPSTSNTRPSTCSPMGTEMGAPVLSTSSFLCKPSVESIASVRTRLPPKCCATSSTRSFLPSRFIFSAVCKAGNPACADRPFSSPNSTSTTGPIICTTFPFCMLFCS